MASKPKSKTYIVLHKQSSGGGRCNIGLGRYRIGARNPNEAEKLLRDKVGKHAKVYVYYEEKNESKFLAHGTVVLDC